jgi:hypothetical protein
MSNEDVLPEHINKICKEIMEITGQDQNQSFIQALKSEIQNNLTLEFQMMIDEKVIPQIRNIEMQMACQISKTNEFYSELKKITDNQSIKTNKLSDLINLVKTNSTQNHDRLENFIKQLNKKAEASDLQTLAKEVAKMTPLNTFFQLQEWTQSLAPKSEISRIDKDLSKANSRISDCPTIEQMINENSKIIVDLRSELSKEKSALVAKIYELKELAIENDGKIESTKSRIQQNNDIFSKKIADVLEFVLEKPWLEEIQMLSQRIEAKATSQEIIDLKQAVEPKMDKFIFQFQEISEDLKDYSSALARFDEVILTKASKEDVKMIQKNLNNIVLQHTMDSIVEEIFKRLNTVEEASKTHKKLIEDSNKEINAFTTLANTQKTQAKDYIKILESMRNLTESIKNKADKADIYSLLDIMGYRDDVNNLNVFVEKIKDFFHQALVLQHEAMTTFLLSGDSPVTKNKHRAEIAKNLEFLMRKVNLKPESHSNASIPVRSKKNLSSVTSIKIDDLIDLDKITSSRAMSTKARRVLSAVNKKHGF